MNSVYEQFFQRFSPNIADTHGIVYTPREIVDFMCCSVDQTLKEEFSKSLASPDVVILDPCTGTGNFVVNIIERMPGQALRQAYQERLFANEVMLLPYYIASLNIEHAYYERVGEYRSFEGLCFVDTLDMAESDQMSFFTAANTDRVERQKRSAVTVIIGNPPYNIGQKRENDNNRNRAHDVVDRSVRNTYIKDSKATSKKPLGDTYVKFFRWAANRLEDRDGIVCFVSNNSFVTDHSFDGMRKHMLNDFDRIDHIDLHGNVVKNPQLSGTTHNVFGVKLGVGITIAIRHRGSQKRLRYHRVAEDWRRSQKLAMLASMQDSTRVSWTELDTSKAATWIQTEGTGDYLEFPLVDDFFTKRSLGLNTNRDKIVYDFNKERLEKRIRAFIADYNAEVDRHRRDPEAEFSPDIKWSSRLKECLEREMYADYKPEKIRASVYRPFTKKWVFLDTILNQRTGLWKKISGRVIAVPGPGNRKPFGVLMSDTILPLDLAFEKIQCYPRSLLRDSMVKRLRKLYGSQAITADRLFSYIYGVLHHPGYRAQFGPNLKAGLPRIPLLKAFDAVAAVGAEIADLHVNSSILGPLFLSKRLTNRSPTGLSNCASRPARPESS